MSRVIASRGVLGEILGGNLLMFKSCEYLYVENSVWK